MIIKLQNIDYICCTLLGFAPILCTYKTCTLHAVQHKAFYHLDGTEPVPDWSSHHVVCKFSFYLTKQNCFANAVAAFSIQDTACSQKQSWPKQPVSPEGKRGQGAALSSQSPPCSDSD